MGETMRALGVHIFAGGFSIGVERAGFELLGHAERSQYGVASWRRYRPGVPVWVDKTAQWSDAVEACRGRVDFLYGNPPCACWSVASAGLSVYGDKSPYLDWARDVVRVGREVGAPVVAIESVRGAMKAGAQFYEALWRENRDQWGGMAWVLVNARDHGVPQDRPRLFVVLAPEAFKFERPAPHSPRTVLDAIAGAPTDVPLAAKTVYAPAGMAEDVFSCLDLLEPGQRLNQVPVDRIRERSAPLADRIGSMYPAHLLYRLREDRPCPVVFSSHPRFVHPREPRLLTLRELMRLTDYPDDFEVVATNQSAACQQLGKTVVPAVGEWLAREVAAYLRGERAARGPGMATFDCSSRGQMTLEDL